MYVVDEGLDPNRQENWTELPGVEAQGLEFAPEPERKPVHHFAQHYGRGASLMFKRQFYVGGRGYGKTALRKAAMGAQARLYFDEEAIEKMSGIELLPWQRDLLRNFTWGMQPTPREELRERLMAKLRGDDPGKPINWKGLK